MAAMFIVLVVLSFHVTPKVSPKAPIFVKRTASLIEEQEPRRRQKTAE